VRCRVWLDAPTTRALLQDVPAAHQVQINDILITALAWAFKGWTGSPRLLMEMEGHGREALFDDVDLTRTVGWLASLFPIVVDVGGAASPAAALGSVKVQLDRIPQRGIGYGLLRYLSGDEHTAARLQAQPQAEVRFNYLGQFDQVLADDASLSPAREFGGPVRSPRGHRRYLLEIDGNVVGGQLQMGWTYSRDLHRDATIERVAGAFIEALRALVASS
jgi:non-ribosomal peptide synthase protein (TIGR01720 family)